jgi:hypothetical protein
MIILSAEVKYTGKEKTGYTVILSAMRPGQVTLQKAFNFLNSIDAYEFKEWIQRGEVIK